MDSAAQEAVTFHAVDGFPLGGTLYSCDGRHPSGAVVLFSTGAGIKAHHYRYFCEFLARNGFPTLAYDYRGIGRSRTGSLRGMEAGFEDWTILDATAALRFLQGRFLRAPVASVSHSIGSLILVGANGVKAISQHVFIGPHLGRKGDFQSNWLRMTVLHSTIMPITTRVLGYFPGQAFGLSDDLPRRVALQWAQRNVPPLNAPAISPDESLWDVTRFRRMTANAKTATGPALILSIFDDPWTSEEAVRRFLFTAPNLSPVRRMIEAHEVGHREVGHWGFFRRDNAPSLWPIVTGFLSRGL